MQGHTLLSARFTNNDRTTIVAEWADNADTNTIRTQYMEADYDNVQYKELLNHIDLDVIHENTIKYYKNANRNIIKYMEKIYKTSQSPLLNDKPVIEIGENMSTNNMSEVMKLIPTILFGDFNSEKYSESLFNLKLAIFELDFIKQSQSRKIKSEIRKAKTPIEILNNTVKIYNEIQNRPDNSKSNKKVSS